MSAAVSLAQQSKADPHLRLLSEWPPDAPQPPSRLASLEEHQSYLRTLDAMPDSPWVRAMREETLKDMQFAEGVRNELRRMDEEDAAKDAPEPPRDATPAVDRWILPKPWRIVLKLAAWTVAITTMIFGSNAQQRGVLSPWATSSLFVTAALLMNFGSDRQNHWNFKDNWGVWLMGVLLLCTPLWSGYLLALLHRIVGLW